MAPIKSSLARTVGKLLGVSKDTDLSLRGDVQSTRFITIPFVDDEFTTSRWNSTSPTASVFSWNDNTSTNDQIAYCWHNVPGLQKFGHYIGSGSDDGTFVELGFRPAIVWVKCNDSDFQEWVVWDNKRSPYNLVDKAIYHHSNATESDNGSSRKVDFLSNGFKLRNGGSGATGIAGRGYLYMAWAEAPAFNLYGAMSSAR